MMELNWSPDNKTLKQFALIGLVGFPGVGAVAYWVWQTPTLAVAFAGLGAAVWLLSVIHTPSVRYVYVAMSVASYPIGFVVSHVVLAAVYYLLFTPMGLIFKLIGRDALERRFDRQSESYWQPYPTANSPDRYFKQF